MEAAVGKARVESDFFIANSNFSWSLLENPFVSLAYSLTLGIVMWRDFFFLPHSHTQLGVKAAREGESGIQIEGTVSSSIQFRRSKTRDYFLFFKENSVSENNI